MFEKSKPLVEDLFVKEIKCQLKEGKTIEFIDSEPSKDENGNYKGHFNGSSMNNDHFHGSSMNKLTTYVDMSPRMLFDQRGMPLVKTDVINGVVEKLNEAQENNFIFYRPIDTKLEYHYEKPYPSAKESVEFFRFWIIFNVEKY